MFFCDSLRKDPSMKNELNGLKVSDQSKKFGIFWKNLYFWEKWAFLEKQHFWEKLALLEKMTFFKKILKKNFCKKTCFQKNICKKNIKKKY